MADHIFSFQTTYNLTDNFYLTLQNKSPILKRKNIFISNHSQLKIDFQPFGYIFCYNWRLLCLAT